MSSLAGRVEAAKAGVGRCVGATIFGVFGGCWLAGACFYAGRLHALEVAGIAVAAAGLVLTATWQRTRGARLVAGAGETEAERRDGRAFGMVNVVTWVVVAVLFAALPRFHLDNYVFPAFVGVVGAHFLALPGRYRHRANLATGWFMIVWAAVCVAAPRQDGERMAVWVMAGAGLTLWTSAVWALRSAERLFRAAAVRGAER